MGEVNSLNRQSAIALRLGEEFFHGTLATVYYLTAADAFSLFSRQTIEGLQLICHAIH